MSDKGVCRIAGATPSRLNITGLWISYKGPRYGPDHVIAKSPEKHWKMAPLEIYWRQKNYVIFFSLTLRAPKLSQLNLNIKSAVPWSSSVVSPTYGALCQSVIMP